MSDDVTVGDVSRHLQDKDIVDTHVFHVVDEDCDGDAVRTVCRYYLDGDQFNDREAFAEKPITATHICHKCRDAIKSELSDSDGLRFSAQEFGTLCDWLMVADPWPLPESRRDRIVRMLNDEAQARGYDDWIQAYHDDHGNNDPREGHAL